MNLQKQAILEQLLTMVVKIYRDTEDFINHPEEIQPWYDFGYADGMVEALNELGYAAQIATQTSWGTTHHPDAGAEQHRWMPWGKAYQHGKETGYREVFEVLGMPLSQNENGSNLSAKKAAAQE